MFMASTQPTGQGRASSPPCTGPIDVLLVEDQPHDAELILRALEGIHATQNVIRVQDGRQALDFLFSRGDYTDRDIRETPRLILLDLKLPRISGLDVLDAIKSDERTRSIPVVALTSSKEERDVQRCYALGVNSYVVKPVDFAQFTQTIQNVVTYWLTTNELPC